MLEIRLLGIPAFTCDGVALATLSASPLLWSLAAYLLVNRNQAQPRSVLASLFWPEQVEADARQNLNAQLWRLRVTLKSTSTSSQPYLLGDKQHVQWNPLAAYWLDVAEFEQATNGLATALHSAAHDAAEIPLLEAALALYRGDFLEGIYDDWCAPHRERMRDRYLLTLEALAAAYQANGRPDATLQTMRRLVAAEPYREAAHARLIELCVTCGRRAEARAQFERYVTICRDDLGLEPSQHMAELAHRHQLDTEGELRSLPAPSQKIATLTSEAKQVDRLPESLKGVSDYRRELEICREFDPLYDVIGDRRRQAKNLDRMEQVAQRLNDIPAQVEALARRAWLAIRLCDYPTAQTVCRRALEMLAADYDPTLEALIRRLIGIADHETGDMAEALNQYAQAMALDKSAGNKATLPASLTNVAAANIALANYTAAIADLECALKYKPAPPLRGRIVGNLGIAWMWLGELRVAAKHLRQAMQLAQRNGDRGDECWVAAQSAILHHLSGDTGYGIFVAEHYRQFALQAEDALMAALFADTLADLHCASGNGARALEYGHQVVRLARSKGLRRYQVRGVMRIAQAYLQLGKPRQALNYARKAVELYSQKNQHLQEEPELFLTLTNAARVAQSLPEGNDAQVRAYEALQMQADRIADCELRKNFLSFQNRILGAAHMSLLAPQR